MVLHVDVVAHLLIKAVKYLGSLRLVVHFAVRVEAHCMHTVECDPRANKLVRVGEYARLEELLGETLRRRGPLTLPGKRVELGMKLLKVSHQLISRFEL